MLDKILASRYQLIATLGRGSFGCTYLAKDIHLPGKPDCVVKKLNPITKHNQFLDIARRLFKTEAKSLQKLGKYSQIPQLLAYFEQDEEFYLVQEFIRGHNLSKELTIGTIWQEQDVIKLLKECALILDFIHSQNVIHRDIKPDNLIRRQQDNRLVLVDFGAVKEVIVQENIDSTIAIGTKGYMPSEQAIGKPHFNSDIYALGIIAIQALTGLEPHKFKENDRGEIIWGNRGEHINPQLKEIINKMTQYYFKDRYLAAKDVLRDLESLRLTEPKKSIDLSEKRSDGEDTIFIDIDRIAAEKTTIENKKVVRELDATQIDADFQKRYRKKNLPKYFTASLVGVILTFSSLILAKISFYQHEKQQRIASLLILIQLNYQQKEYDSCLENVKSKGKKIGLSLEQRQEFIGKCTLGAAETKAERKDFSGAIAKAKQISEDNPFAVEAEHKIADWSQKLIDRIKEIYDREGNSSEIDRRINAIPEGTAVKTTAFKLKNEWQQETDILEQKLLAANREIKLQKWQAAINKAREIENNTTSEYWQLQAREIISHSRQKQAQLKAFKNRQNRILKQQDNRSRIRRPTPSNQSKQYNRSSIIKTPTQNTPKKVINVCPGHLCNQ